jgi:hypothetical protein
MKTWYLILFGIEEAMKMFQQGQRISVDASLWTQARSLIEAKAYAKREYGGYSPKAAHPWVMIAAAENVSDVGGNRKEGTLVDVYTFESSKL